MIMETTTTQICVANRECNLRDDSYFYSTFHIEGTEEFKEVMVGSTAFGGGTYYTEVNASDEVKALYQKWLEREAAKHEATIPRVGKKCKIANARKYKSVGEIVWIGKSRYDSRESVALVKFPDYTETTVNIDRILLVQE
jgi:hypothetical protein